MDWCHFLVNFKVEHIMEGARTDAAITPVDEYSVDVTNYR